ncbi:MAG: hypothetical protein ACXAB7_07275 [Candidatus Kariarchaeaceae archaeon]|jgi:hypothetical protein
MINDDLVPILVVEVFLCMVSITFLVIEVKSLRSVMMNKKTLLLIGFLFSLTMAFFTRSTGIYLADDSIRLLGPTISAIFGGMFIIAWATSLVKIRPTFQNILIFSFLGGLIMFIMGRWGDLFFFEVIGLILSLVIIVGVILKMFFFAFQKSPYIKARQRVFGMMVGFIGFSLFEVAAVVAMSKNLYLLSAILFLSELPFRIILSLSILLPRSVSELMSRWIN